MSRRSFGLAKVYTLLEPGPLVLLTTSHRGVPNVMAMSWHCMLDFEPPRVACVVSDGNHSFAALKATRECVINIPTVDIARQAVGCGNCTGAKVDKFKRYGLTTHAASQVQAPLIVECFANLECRVVDTAMVAKYSMFVLEVVKAWVDPALRKNKTIHHMGYGKFMVGGDTIKLRSRMR